MVFAADTLRIRTLLEPALEGMGYEVIMIELTGSSTEGQVMRVYIDAPGGILLDDCAQVSRQVSAILDVEDPIKGEYTLEVSSPGLDRPLVTPEHFSRFQGDQIKVTMRSLHLGRRRFTGTLSEVGADSSWSRWIESPMNCRLTIWKRLTWWLRAPSGQAIDLRERFARESEK